MEWLANDLRWNGWPMTSDGKVGQWPQMAYVANLLRSLTCEHKPNTIVKYTFETWKCSDVKVSNRLKSISLFYIRVTQTAKFIRNTHKKITNKKILQKVYIKLKRSWKKTIKTEYSWKRQAKGIIIRICYLDMNWLIPKILACRARIWSLLSSERSERVTSFIFCRAGWYFSAPIIFTFRWHAYFP